MSDKVKDILIRALKTFWQGFLASLAISMPEVVNLIPMGWEALKPVLVSAGVGALAAGLSAMWNGVIVPLVNKVKSKANVTTDGGDSSVDEGE